MPQSELAQLPDDLRDVVEELVTGMPRETWRIQPYDGSTHGHVAAKILRTDPAVKEQFFPGSPRGRRLRVVPPNTMALTLYDRSLTLRGRHGLFSLLVDEAYDEYREARSLGGEPGDRASHHGVRLGMLTGRGPGEVSLLLGRLYLRNFSAINVSHRLQQELQGTDTLAAYSLGSRLMFISRGQEFLANYGRVVRGMGIPTNLPEPVAS